MPDFVQPEPPRKPQESQEPPPTERAASAQWMYENTVAYKEHIAHSSFLRTFKDYVTELQQQQLDKSKLGAKAPAAKKPTKPPLTQAKPIPIKSKDTQQNLRDVHTYNATQAAVSQEINDLEELIQKMVGLDPSLQAVLAGPLSRLQAMAKTFPNLTSADMKNLTNTFKLLENMAPRMTLSNQRVFYQKVIKMMKSLQNLNTTNLNAQKAALQEFKNKLLQQQSYVTLAQDITNELKSLGQYGHMSESQLLNLLKQIKALKNLQGELPPTSPLKAALDKFLNQVGAVQVSVANVGVCPIADMLDYALVAKWMAACPFKPSDFANPTEYFDHVRAYLTQKMDAEGLSGGPILDVMGPNLANLISSFKPNLNSTNNLGIVFFSISGNTVTVNPDPLGHVTSVATYINNTSPSISQALGELYNADLPLTEQIQDDINQTQQSITHLGELGKEYGSALGWAYNAYANIPSGGGGGGGKVTPKKGSSSGGSIADQVAHAVINNYMPKQQAYLEALAYMLMFDNLGATIGNDLLNYMSSFPNAGNQFNFAGTYLNKAAGGGYIGSAKAANAQLATERQNILSTLSNLASANAKISSEISKIKASDVSASKKQAMISKLNKLQGEIQGTIASMNSLKADLGTQSAGLKATAIPGKSPSQFTISGWGSTMSVLNVDENSSSHQLEALYTNTTSFQGFYSNGVTIQQAGLQVAMTEIQQEWTIVSTVLQLLNQSYMSVAQGIYKG